MKGNSYRIMAILLAGVLTLSLWGLTAAQDDAPAFLGVNIRAHDDGAYVTRVVRDSAAAEAGLEPGDIIVSVDGSDVTAESLAEIIQGYAVGDTITLGVLRDGETLELSAILSTAPESVREFDFQMPDMTRFSERAFLGVSLANTDDGVRIEEVLSDSAAEEAGLQTGDIITAIGDSAVSTVREAQSAVNAFEPGDDVSVSVSRDGEALDLTVTLGSTGVGTALEFRAPFGDLRYNSETNSIEISEIGEDSVLYQLGLRSGDAITAINGEELSPAGLMGLLATLDEDASLILSVERDGEVVELEIAAEDLTRIGPLFFGFRGGQGIPFDLFGDEGVPFQFRFRGDSDGRGFFNMPGGVQLGVAFITLDEQVAGQQDIDQTEGALITEVLPESPADLAGLQVDDVILAVDGDVLDSERTLRDRLVAYEPGDVVTLDILRGGESLQIEVTLGQVELSSDFMPFGQGQGFHFNIPGDLFGPDGRFEFDGPHGFFNGPDGGFHFNLPDITAVKPDV